MGYFSWNCRHCNLSLRSPDADSELYLNEGVAILSNGIVLVGRYDGYGNLCDSGEQFPMGDNPDVYHNRCWNDAGRPIEFQGGSDAADDQGFFGHEPVEEECEECGCVLEDGEEGICNECEWGDDEEWCDGCDEPAVDCCCDEDD